MKFSDLPAIGQPLESGTFAGLTTTPAGQHCAVVLLADKPASSACWQGAMDWAQTVGGALPSRPAAALLFANLATNFEQTWHWTNETASWDGSYAWLQDFSNGYQFSNLKSFEGRARAVRLIQLTA